MGTFTPTWNWQQSNYGISHKFRRILLKASNFVTNFVSKYFNGIWSYIVAFCLSLNEYWWEILLFTQTVEIQWILYERRKIKHIFTIFLRSQSNSALTNKNILIHRNLDRQEPSQYLFSTISVICSIFVGQNTHNLIEMVSTFIKTNVHKKMMQF